MAYPQNGDRVVDIDSVTSLQPMYKAVKMIPILLGQFCTESRKNDTSDYASGYRAMHARETRL